MKENRKLLKEVLKDIRHDMSDEEVLNLLADSKIRRQLGIYLFLYQRFSSLGDCQYSAGGQGVCPIAVYSAEFGVVLCGGNLGAAYYDESEPAGGKGSTQSGK